MSSSIIVSSWLFGLPVFVAPSNETISFTPPLAHAKTIQVTEVIWKKGHTFDPPLRRLSTTKYSIERPNKFRVDTKLDSFFAVTNSDFITYISDGHTITTYEHGRYGYQLSSEAFNPKVGTQSDALASFIRDSMAMPVAAIPAIREGKQVLLVRDKIPSTSETWYDPKTHLATRMVGFGTWKEI